MGLDYTYYTNTYLGDSISWEDFPRLLKRAQAKFNYWNRIYTLSYDEPTGTEPEGTDIPVYNALCAMMDAMYYYETAASGGIVKSSSIGSVSTSFGGEIDISPKAQDKALLDCLRTYIGVYRGVASNVISTED